MTILSETTQVARKAHWCDSCGMSIPDGTAYRRQVYTDGRDLIVWKEHLLCRAICLEWDWYDGYDAGDVYEVVHEIFLDPSNRKPASRVIDDAIGHDAVWQLINICTVADVANDWQKTGRQRFLDWRAI